MSITIQALQRQNGPGWSVAAYGPELNGDLNLSTDDETPEGLAKLFAAIGCHLAGGCSGADA